MTKIATIRMIALQPWSGAEGNVKTREVVEVVELRARQLEESGAARRATPDDEEKAAAKEEAAAPVSQSHTTAKSKRGH